MRRILVITGLAAAGLLGTVACSGTASADPVVIINDSNTSTSGSASCLPADVAARFPWLPVPVCP